MGLLQWRAAFEPFQSVREFQERVNRLFDDRTEAPSLGVEHGTSTFPPLDIRTDCENVYVIAELPGVAAESLDLSIAGRSLSIKGERKARDVKDEDFHRRERSWGHFTRLVSLPDSVQSNQIEATLKDGILRVRLPKAESAKPRQIKLSCS